MQKPTDPNQTPASQDSAPPEADRAPATRRPYSAPRIASREKIEGRANVCDPLVGGKTGPATCSVARS